MTEYELNKICESQSDCDCKCQKCPFFIGYMRGELGLNERHENDEEYDNDNNQYEDYEEDN